MSNVIELTNEEYNAIMEFRDDIETSIANRNFKDKLSGNHTLGKVMKYTKNLSHDPYNRTLKATNKKEKEDMDIVAKSNTRNINRTMDKMDYIRNKLKSNGNNPDEDSRIKATKDLVKNAVNSGINGSKKEKEAIQRVNKRTGNSLVY